MRSAVSKEAGRRGERCGGSRGSFIPDTRTEKPAVPSDPADHRGERRTATGAPSGLPAQSYLPGGGVSGANFSLLGTFLGLVAFLDGLSSGGRGSCSSSWAPAGSGGENGSGSGRA